MLKEIGLNHGNTFIHYAAIYRRAHSKKIIIIINKDRGMNNKRFSIPCFFVTGQTTRRDFSLDFSLRVYYYTQLTFKCMYIIF